MRQAVEFELGIDADEAVFQSHFPGNPVVPAALLLSAVAIRFERVTGAVVTGAAKFRFSAPGRPGALRVHCEPTAGDRWRVWLHQGETVVMRGLLVAGERS